MCNRRFRRFPTNQIQAAPNQGNPITNNGKKRNILILLGLRVTHIQSTGASADLYAQGNTHDGYNGIRHDHG